MQRPQICKIQDIGRTTYERQEYDIIGSGIDGAEGKKLNRKRSERRRKYNQNPLNQKVAAKTRRGRAWAKTQPCKIQDIEWGCG